jgi:pteridine reductase
MDLKDKAALVTGGAVRLGRALALSLAEQGVRLIIHYGSSAGPAQEVVAQIKTMGGDALALQADFRQSGTAAGLIDRAVEHLGQLDILVNSAAIFGDSDLFDTTEKDWDDHFAINLKSPFFLSQAFAAHIGRERRGHIINIADWRAVHPGPERPAYILTKAGLVTMTQSLALALAPNIQVNVIAPGAILPPPDKDQAYLDQLGQTLPLQRSGSTDEVAQAMLYLLRSDFVTGELIFVTGGEHLQKDA